MLHACANKRPRLPLGGRGCVRELAETPPQKSCLRPWHHAPIRCDGNLRLRSLFDSNTTIFLTSVTLAEGPALSLSTTTTEGPALRIRISACARVTSRKRVTSKRYILTFLKRDGHYVRTYHLRIDPTLENRSHIQNLALMRSATMSAVDLFLVELLRRANYGVSSKKNWWNKYKNHFMK